MTPISTRAAVVFLVTIHLVALAPGFFAPYDYAEQHRTVAYVPPFSLKLLDSHGHIRPSCVAPMPSTSTDERETPETAIPLRFFVHRYRYPVLPVGLANWSSDLHLFGTDQTRPCFLLGTDAYGRDQLSRLLFGAQISLFAGLLGAVISLLLGASLGAAAGMVGNWVETFLMCLTELSMSLPSLYFLFIARAILPLRTSSVQLFVLIVTILGLIGWARPARLVRGVILTAKERDFVKAARGFGASELYLLRRHILPQVSGVLLTQFAVLVPQYILAEVTLSFVGLGVNEPIPSWGNMLTPLQQFAVLDSNWWMFSSAMAAIPVALGYYILTLENPSRGRRL